MKEGLACETMKVLTVPLESYDRVPRARTRVHARVSVNNSVILSTWIKQRF